MLSGYEDQATPAIVFIASHMPEAKGFAFFVVWRVVLERLILNDSLCVDGYLPSYAHTIRCEDFWQSPLLVVVVINVTIVALALPVVVLVLVVVLVP